MKITLAFIAILLAIGLSTQQHFPYQYYGRSSYRTAPYLPWGGYYDSFMSPHRYQYNDDIMGRQFFKGPESPHFAVQDNWNTVVQIPSEKQNDDNDWADVHPRGKLGNRNRVKPQPQYEDDSLEGRNYYNQANVANSYNPFLKTIYYFTSATATTCVVSRCIPAAQFKDVTAQNSICVRKRRELIHLLESLDDGEETDKSLVVPTNVEKVVPTTKPAEAFVNEISSLPDSIQSQVQLMSSKDESKLDGGMPQVKTSSRTKRFFKNLFAVSSTVTIYTFVTSTYTSKLQLADDMMITCRPSDVGIC